jgi:carboxyl-terminal processing protease
MSKTLAALASAGTLAAALAIGPRAVTAGARDDAATAGAPAPAALAEADPARRERNAATFDAMWTIVRDTHWDPAAVGAPWDAAREELRARAEAAADDDALRAVMRDALDRLGQSHFAIIPSELHAADADAAARREGRSGATLAFMKQPGTDAVEAVVVAVEPGSPAEGAGIRPGDRVLAIDGKDPARHAPAGDGRERERRAVLAQALASGDPGSEATWRVEAPGGEPRDATFVHAADARPRAKFGNLPPLPTELTSREIGPEEAARLGAAGRRIGVIAFSIWLIPVARPFDRAVDALRGADGIVIDLRGNPGGIGGMAMGIAGHFTPETVQLGEMRTRDSSVSFATNPRQAGADGKPVEPYAGPVAILVDEGSASTTEIFAGGLQFHGRAKVFGARTAGAALPAAMDPLPNGDVFLHAFADYRLPDGRPLEGGGVRPDNARPYDRADYAREGDPALAEAVRWIASRTERAAPRPQGSP